jgi:acyl-CoA synthetase (AMP-forming)/AMP-acid ligase II
MYLTLPIHRAEREDPDQPFAIFGERRSSRRQFADRVARLGGMLRALGVSAGDRVGMLALNSDRYLEYYFGTWWAGAAVNPVNIRWSPHEIAYSLDDCETRILLVDDTFAPLVAKLRSLSTSLATVVYVGDGPAPADMLDYETLLARASVVADALSGDEDIAAVMYTGGTTGRPKGVMLSHRALFSGSIGSLASIPRARADAICLHAAPMFHIGGLAYAVQHALRLDRQVVIPAFAPAAVLAAIEAEGVTETFLVPTMLRLVLDDPAFVARDLSTLRLLLYGAAPMDAALLERALGRLPQVDFVHVYGMTELSPVITALPAWYHGAEGRRRGKLRSAGRPLVMAEVRIVDERGDPAPAGSVGEITARGPMLMSGYWNRPDETAAALRDGWMHTGDGGFMDEEGFVYVVDRIKDMIISGGENVYSAEVENAILQLPGVAMCAVVGVPDERWGERVHAILVLQPGVTIAPETVIAHTKSLIAGYKCPGSVEFRDALPLSPVGKLLKYQLRAPFWEHHTKGTLR